MSEENSATCAIPDNRHKRSRWIPGYPDQGWSGYVGVGVDGTVTGDCHCCNDLAKLLIQNKPRIQCRRLSLQKPTRKEESIPAGYVKYLEKYPSFW